MVKLLINIYLFKGFQQNNAIFLIFFRADTSLTNDSCDVKYSRSLDSCRLPRVKFILLILITSFLHEIDF